MGLRGMNLVDKVLYWDIKKTWYVIKIYNIHRKITHPLTTESEKGSLASQK